jgi:hypothetical protein
MVYSVSAVPPVNRIVAVVVVFVVAEFVMPVGTVQATLEIVSAVASHNAQFTV